jgi:2-polyprenyl-3-methyl-5-hydroxy-6-metoxy-1,4-benzoquinol methylase
MKRRKPIGSWAHRRPFTILLRKIRLNWILRYVEKEMPMKNGMHQGRILDLGCGDGWLTKELVERNYVCIGSDINLRT